MTNVSRIPDLPAASADEDALVPVSQDGENYKYTLRSAASKEAGTAAGNVPVLDSAGQLPSSVVPGGGGGGGGGSLVDGAINDIDLFAPAMLADEEAILDAGSSNTSLVGNATLKGIIEDLSANHLYGDWTAARVTTQTQLANPGLWTIPYLGGDGTMAVVNGSQFNAINANIGSGRPNLFGPLSSGLPNHTGTQRGCIVILDEKNRRWALPIAEVPDAEATYELVNGNWVARGYRGDRLRIDFAQIGSDDSRYEVFSSLAINGPTDNALRDEVLLARSDGRHQYALRVAYSTADSRYEIVTAKRDAVFNLQAGEVLTSNLASSNSAAAGRLMAVDANDLSKIAYLATIGLSHLDISGKAANKYLSINASNNGLAAVDAPSSTPSFTEEVIFPGTAYYDTYATLSSGKNFSDYDEIYFLPFVEVGGNSGDFISPMFSTKQWATSQTCLCYSPAGNISLRLAVNKSSSGYSLNSFILQGSSGWAIGKIIGRKFA